MFHRAPVSEQDLVEYTPPRRYTLQDVPVPSINGAIDAMLEQQARYESDDRVYENEYEYEEAEVRSMVGGSVHSSQYGNEDSASESDYGQADAQAYSTVPTTNGFSPSRYEPGQLLATINTGETLDMETVRSPAPIEVSAYNTPSKATSSAYKYAAHDVEAYAAGPQSRAYYRPPKSRSPTPFGREDDDYQIDKDGSVHYTGLTPPRQYLSTPQRNAYGGNAFVNTHYSYVEDESYANGRNTPSTLSTTTTLDNDGESERRHFGPAPTGRVLRRHKSKKRVNLTNGNLVVDLTIPPKLVLPYRNEPEMKTTRYTAVTCDPDDFEKNNFFLRQNESGRTTELFIVITMYNEDEILFCRTLYGVMQNIAHLCSRKHSQTWGPDAWKKVVVLIVADGRKKIHPRVLDCLALLGVYQTGGHMKNMIDNKPVTAHLFEYTTSFGLDPDLHFKYPDKGVMPTQIIFCLKEKNQKKINSHRWFFNALAPMLQPNICILLDVGTRPGPTSLYKLWKAFDMNSNVGGACGEIAVYKGKSWNLLLNPLVAAQNFEYKISSILDKPTESMFGYISVLPGAFSAYRYIALKNHDNGTGPLASYFKGEVLHGRDTDIFTSNMYLAEDRILCFELVAKVNSSWVLKYVKGAIGETDVPDSMPEFISQRRRWLNGSLFASTYAIAHVGQILKSGQSSGRKFALVVETVYNIINLIFSWFAIGNYYLFFVILTSSLEAPVFKLSGINLFNTIIQYTMASLVIACFLFSMGNKPQASRFKYKSASVIFAVLTVYLVICSVACAVAAYDTGEIGLMLLALIVTYGAYASSSILAFDPWHMITSFIPYVLLAPTYINILSAYAFCNLDDISWGTKQDDTVDTDLGVVKQDKNNQVAVEIYTEAADVNALYEDALHSLKSVKLQQQLPQSKAAVGRSIPEQEQRAKDYYANVRTNVLLAWVLTNTFLVVGILTGVNTSATFDPSGGETRTRSYMIFILSFMAITSAIRFLASTIYLVTVLITG